MLVDNRQNITMLTMMQDICVILSALARTVAPQNILKYALNPMNFTNVWTVYLFL